MEFSLPFQQYTKNKFFHSPDKFKTIAQACGLEEKSELRTNNKK